MLDARRYWMLDEGLWERFVTAKSNVAAGLQRVVRS